MHAPPHGPRKPMFGNKKTAKPAKASPTPDAATSAEGVAEDASAVAEAGAQGEDFKAAPRKARCNHKSLNKIKITGEIYLFF